MMRVTRKYNDLQNSFQHPPKYMHRLPSHSSSILLTPENILIRQQVGMDMEGSWVVLDL